MAGETSDDTNVNEICEKELKKDDSEQTEQNGGTTNKLVKLPISRIRKIIKMDPDVSLATQEAMVALTKATELFVQYLSREATVYTFQGKRKTIQRKDLAKTSWPMDEENASEEELFRTLVTRANSYQYCEDSSDSPPHKSIKHSKRNASFFKCTVHNPDSKKGDIWKPENSDCPACVLFSPSDHLPNGVLPTRKAIIESLLHLNSAASTTGQKTADSPKWLLSKDIALHWIFCNLYPKHLWSIMRTIGNIWSEFVYLKNYPNSKKGAAYWDRYNTFLSTINLVPDLIETNNKRLKEQELLWNCRISDEDRLFHTLQIQNPPSGYCSTFVSKKWAKSQARKESRQKRSRNEFYTFEPQLLTTELEDDGSQAEEPEFHLEEGAAVKKKKCDYVVASSTKACSDDMPHRLQHIRNGPRSVRPEVYTLMMKLKSKYHMSQQQAEAAIVETANNLFEREWKYFDSEKPTDSNTLPASSNTRRVEPYLEAMALASIVEEIMKGGKCVVYANDGSAQSGVGNYVVQSITLDGVHLPLPTFSIVCETRESLEELEVMTLKMLVAASGHRYTEKQLLERIDFFMTDSTSHNLTVMEKVCDRFGAEAPEALLCNVHPLMMFQRKVKEIFQLLHDTLGKVRIVDCFLVDVDFANEDFITKAIKCLTSFINKDNSAKPWNRQKHFDSFIAPKKNASISYKDHRFNRLFQCCMVLVHHIDDISSYLDTYRNIVNGISILDRSFVEMTLLKPVFCAAALVGIHITLPFQALLTSSDTNYSTLLTAFPLLFTELSSVNPIDLCTTSSQVFHFVSDETFRNVLKSVQNVVLDSVARNILIYKKEIVNLLILILPRLAEGFSTQRGKVFGFGPEAHCDPVTFKIATASEEDLQLLNKSSVHNLSEERSVGSINYELSIRGKDNLEASSKKLLLNKSFSLLEKTGKLSEFKSFRNASLDIKAMKIEWNEKMRKMEEKGHLKKDVVNSHLESIKYKDLEFLKERGGPFTTADQVQQFHLDTPESTEKNARLYTEVRYAKNSCLSLKHTSSVFRLKTDHKNLMSSEYVENLSQYLSDARNKTGLTSDDLTVVLDSLITDCGHQPVSDTTQETREDANQELCRKEEFNPDEHIAAVWVDEQDNELTWFLGVVNFVSEDKIDVTYYHRKNKDGTIWTFPDDDSDPVSTPTDQIIARHITVGYTHTTVVRCSIEQDIARDITKTCVQYINSL